MTALFVCTARFDGYSDRKQRFHELALLAHKSSQICARTVRERFMGYSGEKSSFTCGSPFMCCICSCHHRGPQNWKLVGPPRTASPMRCVPFKFALFGQLAPSPPFGGVHIQMYTYRRTHTGVHIQAYTYRDVHIQSYTYIRTRAQCRRPVLR